LKALFQTDCREWLIFKGGTSLSKGLNIIERFSEDIDLAISHSFFGIEKSNKSQRDKLKKLARKYIQETLSAQIDAHLMSMGVTGYTIENVTQVQDKNGEWKPIDSDKDPTVILLHYPPIIEDTITYIPSRVKIEISCLSMDEPTEERYIHSLIGETFEEDDLDANCKIRTVVPTSTFLEKIFLLAEEFQKDKPRSVRMSRHLRDMKQLALDSGTNPKDIAALTQLSTTSAWATSSQEQVEAVSSTWWQKTPKRLHASRFFRSFKAVTGLSPKEWLTQSAKLD
jgi:AraC-like DNA-binding protein